MSKLKIGARFSLPDTTVTSTLIVYGGKGTGKTNFGGVLVEELFAAQERFCAIDPVGVWGGIQYASDKTKTGLPILRLGGKDGDFPIKPAAGVVIADLVADESVSTVVDISRDAIGKMWRTDEQLRFTADFCTRLYERQGESRRPLMLVIDECGRLAPQLVRKGARNAEDSVAAIERLVELGRNVAVGVCLMTQRSARMAKSISELADAMIAFRTVGPRSTDAVLDWFGDHIAKTEWDSYLERLRKLPIGTALVVSPGWLNFEGEVAVRERWTFDASATPTSGKAATPRGRAAKPDLDAYRQRMSELIAQAEADDPRALRARITELERELAKKATVAPARIVTKEVPAFSKKEIETVERLATATAKAASTLIEVADGAERTRGVAMELLERVRSWKPSIVPTTGSAGNGGGGRPADGVAVPAVNLRLRMVPAQGGQAPSFTNGVARVEGLPRGHARVLTAIAQHAEGVRREQLSVLTGYKRRSRDTYLQHLRTSGYIEPRGDALVATDAGVAALGTGFEKLPTGDALRAHWLARLPAGERRVLESVLSTYPRPIEREGIDRATGYKRRSRDTYLQKLASRRLVVSTREGVTASAQLFD